MEILNLNNYDETLDSKRVRRIGKTFIPLPSFYLCNLTQK